MQNLTFNASTPLYIASGLLSYNDTSGEGCPGGQEGRQGARVVPPSPPPQRACRGGSWGIRGAVLIARCAVHLCLPVSEGLQQLSQHMLSKGLADRVVVKEELLPAADLAGEACQLCTLIVGAQA